MISILMGPGGSLVEDGRIMDIPSHLSASGGGQLYGGSAVVVATGPRSSGSSSSSSQSSQTGGHPHGTNGKMSSSNGPGSGRKYQCKMCPQVNGMPFFSIASSSSSLYRNVHTRQRKTKNVEPARDLLKLSLEISLPPILRSFN